MFQDDLQLLREIRRGDERAATELWRRWSPRLIALARLMSGDATGAEDVVQRVFLRLVRLDAPSAAGIADLGAYLVMMVRNEVRNAARAVERSARHEAGSVRVQQATAAAPLDHDDELQQAIDALPPEQAELLRLKHVAELTFAQVGLVLDVNSNTIASRYRSAVDALRTLLRERSHRDTRHPPGRFAEVTHD